MSAAELLAKAKRKIGLTTTTDDLLLGDLISDAGYFILTYTGQSIVPTALYGAQVDLAIIAYNQRGAEGNKSRGEGGVSMTFDTLPLNIELQLKAYRLARAVSML
jgi:hypothetical protein